MQVLTACGCCPVAGRVFAVEMALYTIAETVSGFWGGFMFDGLRLSTQGSSFVMAIVGTAVTVRAWVASVRQMLAALYESHTVLWSHLAAQQLDRHDSDDEEGDWVLRVASCSARCWHARRKHVACARLCKKSLADHPML